MKESVIEQVSTEIPANGAGQQEHDCTEQDWDKLSSGGRCESKTAACLTGQQWHS